MDPLGIRDLNIKAGDGRVLGLIQAEKEWQEKTGPHLDKFGWKHQKEPIHPPPPPPAMPVARDEQAWQEL